MAKIHTVQTNFISGELDPLAHMRIDSKAYGNGLARCRNAWIYNTGGWCARPGFGHLVNMIGAVRLFGYEFDDNEQYVLAFSNTRLDVYDLDGTIVDTITGCAWTTAILNELKLVYTGDTIMVFHYQMQPQKITRSSLTEFTVAAFAFQEQTNDEAVFQPYFRLALDTVRMTPSSATAGSITLTCSTAYFQTGHIGSVFRIHECECEITAVTAVGSSGAVTGAANNGSGLIRLTVTAHGLSTGDMVTVASVGGVPAATGTWTVTNIGANTFDLQGSTFAGAFTSGGTATIYKRLVATATLKKALRFRLDNNPMKSVAGSGEVECTWANHGLSVGDSVTFYDCNDGSGISAGQVNGARTINKIVDDNKFQFTAGGGATGGASSGDFGGGRVEVSSIAQTYDWDEQLFSSVNGWPACATLHEDRLVLAGGPVPDGLWLSRTGKYFNFDIGDAEDDDSIQVVLGGEKIAQINDVVSSRHLQIFTSLGEYYIPQLTGDRMTPGNLLARKQTSYGNSLAGAVPFDGATLFCQRTGTAIREFLYNDGTNSYEADNVALLSAHLIHAPVCFDVLHGTTERPEQLAFFVNEDGTMAVFCSVRSEGVANWGLWTAADSGLFTSVCVVNDTVYAAVNRSGTYSLERMSPDDAITLDRYTTQTGASNTSWTLNSIFASKTVHVIADGVYVGTKTATGGAGITLDTAATEVTVGFLPDLQVRTLPPVFQVPFGTTLGKRRRIARAVVHVDSTMALEVSGQTIRLLDAEQDAEETGKYVFNFLGYSRDPYLEFTRDTPVRARVLGMMMEVAF